MAATSKGVHVLVRTAECVVEQVQLMFPFPISVNQGHFLLSSGVQQYQYHNTWLSYTV